MTALDRHGPKFELDRGLPASKVKCRAALLVALVRVRPCLEQALERLDITLGMGMGGSGLAH